MNSNVQSFEQAGQGLNLEVSGERPVSGNGVLQIARTAPDARLPLRAHPDDAGLDLYGLEDFRVEPQQGKVTRTGIAMAIPTGHVGMVVDRSSMAKKGLKIAGGIIDAGYRGEVHVVLWNLSADAVEIKAGERIAQMMIVPIRTPAVEEVPGVEALGQTSRGTGGFGSTGK